MDEHETHDAAKLREALESIASNLEHRLFARYPRSASDEWMYQKANTALAAPARNCDVLSAQEQAKQWEKFCSEHHKKWIGDKIPTGPCECPCYEGNSCNFFLWAQMPYVEKKGGGE